MGRWQPTLSVLVLFGSSPLPLSTWKRKENKQTDKQKTHCHSWAPLWQIFLDPHARSKLNWCIIVYTMGLVRALRDSRATLMPIYGDLYQIKLWGITNENHLVTHLGFTSGRHYDVIKITYIVLVQFKRYVHCSLWRSELSCILLPISVEMHQIQS